MRRRSPPRARQTTTSVVEPSDDRVEQLIDRARRLRRKGDLRKALLVMREACQLDAWRSRPHVLLGSWLLTAGRQEEAAVRLRHARWLCHRAGSEGRARSIEQLLAPAHAA